MREILFRGKSTDNGEWVEGYLMQKGGEPLIARSPYFIGKVHETSRLEFCFGGFIEVIPETVGQFTGLTDKNGNKIFDGDILKIVHKYQSPFDDDTKEYTDIDTDVVHFDDEGLCFSYGKSPFLCVVDNVTAEYEVIGNIHDNPELLEVAKMSLKKMNDHFADVRKMGTMSLTLALIVLDRLNTTERIDVARDNLAEAVRVVSAAAKYRIPQKAKPDLYYYEYGECPTCGVFSDKSKNYCSNCGQALNWK